MKIQPGSRLLFIGDSVTDCDRARPIGAGSQAALGHGYVSEVASALASSPARPPIQVTNMGISGNTVRDLSARWESDVIALKPDWLSIMIGINDVWRQFDVSKAAKAAAVMPGEFRGTLDRLVARALPGLKGLVLMSPVYVQDRRSDPMRSRVDEYGSIVRELAAIHGATFVDVQASIDAALGTMDYAAIAGDRVHPTPDGHRLLARAFLGAV
jgi:lysophospholipase L1-like esterase